MPIRMVVCPSGTRGQVVNGKFTCVPTGLAPAPSPAPAPAPATDPGPQIAAAAQQALSSMGPAPSSGDFAGSIIYQVVSAALNQLASNPTVSQLATTMTNIQGTGGSNLQQSSQAQAAYNILTALQASLPAAASGADLASAAVAQAGMLLREMTGKSW